MSEFACVFPGQGSQSVGMIAELYNEFESVRQIFSVASEALEKDLWQLTNSDAESLNQTHNTQPALLTASIAVWTVLAEKTQQRPKYFAGHSLGEYTALVAAGVIGLGDAVKLVAKRGELMQQAVPAGVGAMAAVLGLDDEAVQSVCDSAKDNDVLSPVNFNSPGQVVIAGNKAAVERACIAAKEAGAKRAIVLPVSVPSHCELMVPAAEAFKQDLESVQFNDAKVPVVNNVDVAISVSGTDIKDALVRQLSNPVRWVESVRFMHADGVAHFIEAGPGKVLAGLNKRIIKAATHSPVFDIASLNKALDVLKEPDAA